MRVSPQACQQSHTASPEKPREPCKFIDANDMACRRLGYTRAELLNVRVPEIDAPETRAAIPAIMEKLRQEKFA